uniref:Uncharacterized protein n=1 Tax=Arion vulgaris TaxID=1028688 RepID=A0A0B7AI74_9EUPU
MMQSNLWQSHNRVFLINTWIKQGCNTLFIQSSQSPKCEEIQVLDGTLTSVLEDLDYAENTSLLDSYYVDVQEITETIRNSSTNKRQ